MYIPFDPQPRPQQVFLPQQANETDEEFKSRFRTFIWAQENEELHEAHGYYSSDQNELGCPIYAHLMFKVFKDTITGNSVAIGTANCTQTGDELTWLQMLEDYGNVPITLRTTNEEHGYVNICFMP